MPLTVLDPVTALIVVDLQRSIVDLPLAHPVDPVIERNRALLAAFRARGLPVVLVNVEGTPPGRAETPPRLTSFPPGWADLIPELEVSPSDLRITKHSWGAFATTGLETRLRTLGVTQVVITGIATATGVEATARQAYEAGFNVTLASDAMTDARAEAHDHSIAHIFPRLGETGTSAAIIALLER